MPVTMRSSIIATYSRTGLFSSVVDKAAHVSTRQIVILGWDKEQLGELLKLRRSSTVAGIFGIKSFSIACRRDECNRPYTKSPVPLKRPPERQMGSKPPPSGPGERSKDSVPATPSLVMDEDQFPPLSRSSLAEVRKSSKKGKSRGSPAQVHTHSLGKPQEQKQIGLGSNEEMEKQAISHRPSKPQESTEGALGVRDEMERQVHSPLPSKPQVSTERALGVRDEMERQVHTPLPSKPQEPKEMGLGFREAMESPRNSNLDRQRADHDSRRKAGGRQGPQFGNGLEAVDRRDGPQYSQGKDAAPGRAEFIDALGRTLTKILRHQAVEMKLEMSGNGYVNVQDLLKLPVKTRLNRFLSSHSIDDVKQAVEEDSKQRFGTKEENGQLFIRANQGHSMEIVESDQLLKPIVSADEVPVCVHGTYRRNLDQIMKEGLKRMTRNHVHFATGVVGSDGVISGMRSSSQILVYLNVKKALADGMKLYISANKVILTEGFQGVVPPEYFKEVLRVPDMKRIAPPSVPA